MLNYFVQTLNLSLVVQSYMFATLTIFSLKISNLCVSMIWHQLCFTVPHRVFSIIYRKFFCVGLIDTADIISIFVSLRIPNSRQYGNGSIQYFADVCQYNSHHKKKLAMILRNKICSNYNIVCLCGCIYIRLSIRAYFATIITLDR